MSTINFGLMLQTNSTEMSANQLLAYNKRLMQVASSSPGFTTLWMEDHLQWKEDPTLECFSSLCFLAAKFPRFKVGTLVLSQAYRNPALLAKMAANLQFLSGGRLILGLGAGWKEDEYRAYSYPFPNARTRVAQLEEAVQVIRTMWTSRPANFTGQYYTISDAYCEPQPSPMIPLLIGGGGEQRTLNLVARYADWYNFNSATLEEYAHKVAILKEHCNKVGRNPAEIKLTYLSTMSVADDPAKVVRNPQKHFVAGNTAEVIRELQQFCEIGVTHFMFRFLDVETLERFVERVVPHFYK
jgi:alkanesulfonate monooxygenase SsuD/methylene tetrahydromethanopterin reductase-like flavin-dependent oxidoreductase (luciferase family)